MRCITITYDYDGPEEAWTSLTGAFLAALDADKALAGKFTYQIAVADNGKSRVHWGRWDSEETLAKVQSQAYFKVFAAGLRELASDPPTTLGANVAGKTAGW